VIDAEEVIVATAGAGDGTGGSSTLRCRLTLKAGQADLGEVTSAAIVVADRRAGMLLQAVFVRLRAAATIAILYPFAPLLDDVLVGQSLEVGIDVVGIDIHGVGIVETGGGARNRRRVTKCACLVLIVLQIGDLQVNGVAIGLERGVVFSHNREVQEPIDVIGVQGLLETIKQILIRPAGARGPSLKVGHKLPKGTLALLHPDNLVLCISLGTDRLELQLEHRKKGVSIREGYLFFGKRFNVGSGPHSCILDHERKGQGDHFVYVQYGGSISTLDLLSLSIAECEAVFVHIDPDAEGTPE
jgi:hypothetical protein